MSDTTGIEWADATVNVWTGCTKVSPACKHCYAETDRAVLSLGARVRGKGLPMWGANGYRYETANWERELRKLNKVAEYNRRYREEHNLLGLSHEHTRPRVFINSLSDVFEDFDGDVYRLEDGKPVVAAQSLGPVRARFFRVAEECAGLDILLLTKRPENVYNMVPGSWRCNWRPWVWIGTTVEDVARKVRADELRQAPAAVRFLSIEPLLEDLGTLDLIGIHWVIVGGESGKGARPMHPDWVRSIRDQCVAAGVPFFFKQWGEWRHVSTMANDWPQEWPRRTTMPVLEQYYRPGKKNAGRLLDGREWNEVPK